MIVFSREEGEPVDRQIYLDFNATTPIAPEAVEACHSMALQSGMDDLEVDRPTPGGI